MTKLSRRECLITHGKRSIRLYFLLFYSRRGNLLSPPRWDTCPRAMHVQRQSICISHLVAVLSIIKLTCNAGALELASIWSRWHVIEKKNFKMETKVIKQTMQSVPPINVKCTNGAPKLKTLNLCLDQSNYTWAVFCPRKREKNGIPEENFCFKTHFN